MSNARITKQLEKTAAEFSATPESPNVEYFFIAPGAEGHDAQGFSAEARKRYSAARARNADIRVFGWKSRPARRPRPDSIRI